MKKILIICPYPAGIAPSQRFRFEQYLGHLKESGFQTVIKPFFSIKAYSAFYESANFLPKIQALVKSYLLRLRLLFHLRSFDFVFIHRESTPVGPPIIEWVISKLLRKKIIYDFDDAIWLTDRKDESAIMKTIRWRRKVRSICRWSYKISCGNKHLAAYARQNNSNVIINPTTIDHTNLHVPKTSTERIDNIVTIGWTGSHSTLKYVETLIPVLKALEKKYPQVRSLIIADKNPMLPLSNTFFRAWDRAREVRDLQEIDIGIMPLPDDEWTRGKCGFKALQYMAMAIPAAVSPVGVNGEIVEHGVEGYWCTTDNEWFSFLEDLILNRDKRIEMGKRGRQKVISSYSVVANSANFLSLFQ